VSNRVASAADRIMIRLVGMPYLRLTRDALIHERCRYLVRSTRELGRGGLRVLDVGCGSGIALYYLSRLCHDMVHDYVGIDMNVDRLHKRWKFVNLPHAFCQVNLDNDWNFGKFGLVWCSEVIEHLIEDEDLFSRMASHLDASGVLIITTPNRAFVEKMGRAIPGFDYISLAQDGGHVRTGYEPEDFMKMASRNGLVLASHAWLSPCSVGDVRMRVEKAYIWNCIASAFRGIARWTPSVVDDEAPCRPRAENYWSLAVSLVKRIEAQDTVAMPDREDSELHA